MSGAACRDTLSGVVCVFVVGAAAQKTEVIMINRHTLALIDTVFMMIGKLIKWLSHDRRAKLRKRILTGAVGE